MELPLIAQRVFNRPLMVSPARLVVLERFLVKRYNLPLVFEPGLAAFDAEPPTEPAPRRLLRKVEGVAVIDVHGTLVQRSGGMDPISGLVSYSEVRGELETALADQSVRSIVLNLDSPGGEVAGCFALADRIREASAEKPIFGFANEQACSACYALGAACTAFYVTETGDSGSVGVVLAHIDQSAADASQGYKVTHIYSGARKVDGNPHEPLGDEARASLQAQVDHLAGIFREKVAAWRGISPAAVQSTEAGIFIGAQAVAAGLADDVMSADAVLTLAMNGGPVKPRLEGNPETKDGAQAAPPPPASEPCKDCGETPCECEEDTASAVAAKFPKASVALRAEGATQERARIAALEALMLPGHDALLRKAIADGMTDAAFALEQTKAERANPGRSYLEARRTESAAADVRTAVPVAATKPPTAIDPAKRAADEWDRDPKIQQEFASKDSYVAYVKAESEGRVRMHRAQRG